MEVDRTMEIEGSSTSTYVPAERPKRSELPLIDQRLTPGGREFGASNEPDTCLWCGRDLQHRTVSEWKGERGKGGNFVDVGVAKLGGSYSDGVFCGLRCGYHFGLAFADDLHRRLKPKTR